ncbi:acetate/propionate family kinase [Candidatus Saccharibacteria bacterium]|jgi:acetate kinase|nr:acetate/propionate family kinase [Candidatus Saccharibacteria bacterium]
MAMEPLILAANPGSASRKYALYRKQKRVASINFEYENNQIIGSLTTKRKKVSLNGEISELNQAASKIIPVLRRHRVIRNIKDIGGVGLRVVAPSGYFLSDHLLDEENLHKLDQLEPIAPLHIKATLQEARSLRTHLKNIPVLLVSDSAFHITKPDYAWNYAIPLEDADRLEIKRYGYHGISISSIVNKLKAANKLPPKLIVCHLGSGSSITAVLEGNSIDNSMGYSPLEGLMMATRSGSIDVVAALTLKRALQLRNDSFEAYLNNQCGLKGISGSSADIRKLLEYEANGDYRAGLALKMYVYHIQQSIGQAAAVLNGVDALVFTGTVGIRSSVIRERITRNLSYLGLELEEPKNSKTFEPKKITKINPRSRIKPIFVITTNEELEMVNKVRQYRDQNNNQ